MMDFNDAGPQLTGKELADKLDMMLAHNKFDDLVVDALKERYPHIVRDDGEGGEIVSALWLAWLYGGQLWGHA